MNIADTTQAYERTQRAKVREGSCFCGAVRFKVTGEPAAMGYCHCESCRHWSASPANAFTLWKPEALEFVQGADAVGTYNKTPGSFRKWCVKCGGHICNQHPGLGLVDVYAAVIPDLPFKPAVHVNYQETKLRILDGLPKIKDFTKEFGGSGIRLEE